MACQQKPKRGFTLRALVVSLTAMLLMGIWIEYVERYCRYGGPLGENVPPNAAVGVILVVMGVSTLLYFLRRSLRLAPAELLVIYAALILAAPMMTQGLWGRMFGLMAAIPKNQDFKSYESLPSMLWPHGPNLLANGRFTKELQGFDHVGGGVVAWTNIDRRAKGIWRSPLLHNAGETNGRVSLAYTFKRFDKDRQVLIPGERFLYSMLVKVDELQKNSFYFVEMQADTGAVQNILMSASVTKPTFANQGGFMRVGVSPITIPPDLQSNLTFRIGMEGEGALVLQDIQFFNVEAIEGLFSGRNLTTESDLAKLGPDERDFLVVKPDNMFSLRGLRFLVSGYIPLRQWLQPAAVWIVLFGGLFAGFLGLNILLRKQWAENERFAFPQVILPRNLFAETEDDQGGVCYALLRNRAMWLGLIITLPLVLLRGLHFYNPAIPAPMTPNIFFANYFINPLARAFFQDVAMDSGSTGAGFSFSLLAIALLIDTNILFSLWVSFFLFQLWNLFGKAFNWTRFPGYPWKHQQHMGSFIGYALLALFVARRHLAQVFRVIFSGGDPARMEQGGERGTYRVALTMVLFSLALVAGWGVLTGMGWAAGLLFFSYMLIVGFAASKIRAECGAPFSYMTPYYGMQFVAAVGGFAVFGSTGMLVATIASGFMTTASFLLMAPTQVEMIELGRQMNVRRQDVWAGLSLGLLGALLIGGFVLLCWAYGFGANRLETTWPYAQYGYFSSFQSGEAGADRAFENNTLLTTPEMRPLDMLHNVDAKGLGIGVAVTWLFALLRSMFMWFPLHPIGYVLAPSYFMGGFWFCAFMAWLIRLLVLRVGGARSIREGLVPFCVGMFLACILSIFIFDLYGVYLRLHGITTIYSAMP